MNRFNCPSCGYPTIEEMINSNNPETIVRGLLSLALNADDGEFVQDLMVRYSQHKNENVRGIAILCFAVDDINMFC